jgi:hypothetical protein
MINKTYRDHAVTMRDRRETPSATTRRALSPHRSDDKTQK